MGTILALGFGVRPEKEVSDLSQHSDGQSIGHHFPPLDSYDCYGYRTLQQVCMPERLNPQYCP